MRVLIDARWSGTTGIGRFLQEVLARVPEAMEMDLFNGNANPTAFDAPWALARLIRSHPADVFWNPGFVPPSSSRVPVVITIHDLIHRVHYSPPHRLYYDLVYRPFARRATRIITVSEYSKRAICEWAGIPAERVMVSHNGVDRTHFRPDGVQYTNGGRPYLCYVGNYRSYKNVHRLIAGFAAARLPSEFDLLLSGEPPRSLQDLVRRLHLESRVKFLGAVDEAMLPALYRGAHALIYVSLHEGFGLPPLEAMACGTPVVASATTSLPEVVGKGGLLVDPFSIDAIADSIQQIASNEALRQRLRAEGLEQASVYSWEKTSERIWAAVRSAARG